MSPIAPALDLLGAEIAGLTARLGRRVDVEALGLADRRGQLRLATPGLISPNRACRLVRAADGWIAVNLAREEDRDLIPAWLGCELEGDLWAGIKRMVRRRRSAELLANAILLGLPVSRVGEAVCDSLTPPFQPVDGAATATRRKALRVIDLSALWAGPMCGAILADMGATVVKVESVSRPDPTRASTPEFFRRLNGGKSDLRLDFTTSEGKAALRAEILAADLLVTSARPRAFAPLGLAPDLLFAANPSLVWVAITGYGWTGAAAERVAFGDDAAAAGGLVRRTPSGQPRFLGDALADPVTGLAAALGALRALIAGGGVLVDVAMARCSAAAAATCRLACTP